MKINYDIIKHNIDTYEEAKSILPAISQYERGEISGSVLFNLGLKDFVEFNNFKRSVEERGYPLIENIDWRKLKPILIDKTETPRLKKYMFNRTKSSFDSILSDEIVFDRLINGRWVNKPKQRTSKRGGMTYGRRSDERVDALSFAIIPLLNYIITNDLEIVSMIGYDTNVSSYVRWYSSKKLSLDKVPKREIDITNKLLINLDNLIVDSRVDFRKLNIDYITNAISTKLSKLMSISDGTSIKCINDYTDQYGLVLLSKDRYYETKGSNISNGHLRVYVSDNFNRSHWFDYSNFEDMTMHRDDLLNSLFGE